MYHLIQPIFSSEPEIGHDPKQVLTFDQFVRLLKKEEQYFDEDKFNTRLMITRLRKIFYDGRGWNSQLIKKVAFIKGRYKTSTIECPQTENNYSIVSKIRRYKKQ